MKVYTRFPLLHKMAHPVECHVDHPPLCARDLEKYCARPHVRCCFSNWVVLRLPGKRHQQSGGEQPQEKTNFPSSDHLETKLSVFDCFVSTQILVRAWHWLGKKEVQQRNTLASKILSLGKVWKYANKWIFEKKNVNTKSHTAILNRSRRRNIIRWFRGWKEIRPAPQSNTPEKQTRNHSAKCKSWLLFKSKQNGGAQRCWWSCARRFLLLMARLRISGFCPGRPK